MIESLKDAAPIAVYIVVLVGTNLATFNIGLNYGRMQESRRHLERWGRYSDWLKEFHGKSEQRFRAAVKDVIEQAKGESDD